MGSFCLLVCLSGLFCLFVLLVALFVCVGFFLFLFFFIWMLELWFLTRMTISLSEKCSTCAVLGPTGYHALIRWRKKAQTIEKRSSLGADRRESIACGIHLPSHKAQLISNGSFCEMLVLFFFSLLFISLVTASAFRKITSVSFPRNTFVLSAK